MRRGMNALDVLSAMSFESVMLVGDDRRYVRANTQGANLLGATREHVLSHSIDDFTSPQFATLLPSLWSALERDGRLSGSYEMRRGDGSTGMIEFAANWDLFPGQHLILARDLPRNPSSRTGFALLDPRDGDIYEASPELCRLTGRTRSDLLGKGLAVFGGGRQRDVSLRAVRSIASRTEDFQAFQCRVRRPGGGIQWLAVTLRPMLGAGSRAIRVLLEAIPLVSAPLPADQALSARECEVLQLAADGGTAATIAGALVLSPGTVRAHLRNIYGKLGTHDRAAAVAEGMRRGLIE
jgi:PAS domain S-box-containing protein